MPAPIAVVALLFLGMGVYALITPAAVVAIFGTSVTTPDGRNEIRAVYGGFGIMMALALVVALRVGELRAGILVCLALALVGMALGRVCSAIIDRRASLLTTFIGGLELAGAVVLWMYRTGV